MTSAQAHRVGVGNVELHRLVARGDLHRLRRGVYRHAVAPYGMHEEVRAAWLSLYPAMSTAERRQQPHFGVLRAESAALLQGMGDLDTPAYAFYVPERKNLAARDIELRREKVPEEDISMVHGLPVTTPTRTILDLLDCGHEPEHIGEAVADARREGLDLDVPRIERRLEEYSRKTGLPVKSAEFFVLEQPLRCAPVAG